MVPFLFGKELLTLKIYSYDKTYTLLRQSCVFVIERLSDGNKDAGGCKG